MDHYVVLEVKGEHKALIAYCNILW